jgi:hypothetical protein
VTNAIRSVLVNTGATGTRARGRDCGGHEAPPGTQAEAPMLGPAEAPADNENQLNGKTPSVITPGHGRASHGTGSTASHMSSAPENDPVSSSERMVT